MRLQKIRPIVGLIILAFSASSVADVAYRPESDLAKTFADKLPTAEIAVYPTIVRTPYMSRFSTRSQSQVLAFLRKNKLGTGTAADRKFYLGALQARSQFEMFQNSMRGIREQITESALDADYALVIEVVFPPVMSGLTQVFGIHVYLLDADGNNAFSFLMNSHHKAFAEAELTSWKDTAESKEQLAIKGTGIALDALAKLVAEVRACLSRGPAKKAAYPQAGVLLDFDSDLPAGTNKHGVPMGYSTFSDGKSTVSISTTTEYPPRTGAAEGNKVLEVDLNVTGWAGVVQIFTNAAADTWVAQDWREFDGFSFLFYGNNSGAALFVDVIDNRKLCSTSDDAERYVYGFVDDFSGWQRVSVRFADMARKEVGNNAPNDGLGLSDMHGWGFGTGRTEGRISFYIDDFELWRASTETVTAPAGMFEEKRIDDSSSTLIFRLDDSDRHVYEKSMDLMCACARLATGRGFSFFNTDRQVVLADRRGSFRINFYETVPENLRVPDFNEPADILRNSDPENFALDAAKMNDYCELWKRTLDQPAR